MVEPAQPIRLIALDIDGTLVGEDLVIGQRTRSAVREARRRGIYVSLVTGRMAMSAIPFARELELAAPIVAQQGALIRSMPEPGSSRQGRLLYHRTIEPAVTVEIVRWCQARNLTAPLQLPGMDGRWRAGIPHRRVPDVRGRSAPDRRRTSRREPHRDR